MSKQKKKSQEVKSSPEIYAGLNTNTELKAYVVEDVHMLYYIFDSKSHVHIVKEAIQKGWDGFNAFAEENKNTILAYHDNFFKVNPPEEQALDITAAYCWSKIISLAVDRRTTKVPVNASGRKSTIGLCEYRAGVITEGDGSLKTPQAKACLKLFRQRLALAEGDDKFILEADLRKYIEEHASELHTRQDPWRIFQYYRPNLIQEKLITRK